MYRIDSSGNVGSIPVPAALGTEGYWSWGNPGIPLPATQLDQDWFNMLQESLMALVTAADIPHSKTDYTGLLQAILALATMTDVGTVNSLAVNPPVALPTASSIVNGTVITVIPAFTNTGAATLAVSGGGASAIIQPDGSPLIGGALTAGVPASFMKQVVSSAPVWWLIGLSGGSSSSGATNIVSFTTSSSWTVPAGVSSVKAIVTGGGGGGGGGDATHDGSGGGAGGTAIKICAVTPGQVITVTVGAGGATNSGDNPAANGGSSSFGAFCSATGGTGGTAVSGGAGSFNPGGPGGTGTGGVNLPGGFGTDSYYFSSTAQLGGVGGASYWGGGGRAAVNGNAQSDMNGQAPGSGAGGTYVNTGSVAGGDGAGGIVYLEW